MKRTQKLKIIFAKLLNLVPKSEHKNKSTNSWFDFELFKMRRERQNFRKQFRRFKYKRNETKYSEVNKAYEITITLKNINQTYNRHRSLLLIYCDVPKGKI